MFVINKYITNWCKNPPFSGHEIKEITTLVNSTLHSSQTLIHKGINCWRRTPFINLPTCIPFVSNLFESSNQLPTSHLCITVDICWWLNALLRNFLCNFSSNFVGFYLSVKKQKQIILFSRNFTKTCKKSQKTSKTSTDKWIFTSNTFESSFMHSWSWTNQLSMESIKDFTTKGILSWKDLHNVSPRAFIQGLMKSIMAVEKLSSKMLSLLLKTSGLTLCYFSIMESSCTLSSAKITQYKI